MAKASFFHGYIMLAYMHLASIHYVVENALRGSLYRYCCACPGLEGWDTSYSHAVGRAPGSSQGHGLCPCVCVANLGCIRAMGLARAWYILLLILDAHLLRWTNCLPAMA